MGMVLNTYWLSFAWFQFVDRLPFKIISILQVRLVIQLHPNFRRIVNVLSFVQKKASVVRSTKVYANLYGSTKFGFALLFQS